MFRSLALFLVGLALATPITAEPVNSHHAAGHTPCIGPSYSSGILQPPAPRERFALLVEQNQPTETSVFLRVTVRIQLDAKLFNCGAEDANHITVVARARIGDRFIPINGSDRLDLVIGTLPAGDQTSRDVSFDLSMTLQEGRAAEQNGIIFELAVVSDLGSEVLAPLHCTSNSCERLEAPTIGSIASRLTSLPFGKAGLPPCPRRLAC